MKYIQEKFDGHQLSQLLVRDLGGVLEFTCVSLEEQIPGELADVWSSYCTDSVEDLERLLEVINEFLEK